MIRDEANQIIETTLSIFSDKSTEFQLSVCTDALTDRFKNLDEWNAYQLVIDYMKENSNAAED